VVHEQAVAFRSKLWQLHVDSRRAKQTTKVEDDGPDTVLGHLKSYDRSTSRESDVDASLPFKERIRPGMAVSWTPTKEYNLGGFWKGLNIAVVLCPAAGVGPTTRDTMGRSVDAALQGNKTVEGRDRRYLCALVTPGVMQGAYEVNLWRHVVLDVDCMDKELVLEYDSATRFYHLGV
jgi:kinesin family protein 2/24